jgi:hypothetical protein
MKCRDGIIVRSVATVSFWAAIITLVAVGISTPWTWNKFGEMHVFRGNCAWVMASYRGQYCLFYKEIYVENVRFSPPIEDDEVVFGTSRGDDHRKVLWIRDNIMDQEIKGSQVMNDCVAPYWRWPRYERQRKASGYYFGYVDLPLGTSSNWAFSPPYERRYEPADPAEYEWSCDFPNWLPAVMALAVLWFASRRQRRYWREGRRVRRGLCARCGYNVRASKDRCPECGTPIPAASGVVKGSVGTEHASERKNGSEWKNALGTVV